MRGRKCTFHLHVPCRRRRTSFIYRSIIGSRISYTKLSTSMPSASRLLVASACLMGSALGFEALAGFKLPSLQSMQKAAANKAQFGDKKLAVVTGTSSGAPFVFLPRSAPLLSCTRFGGHLCRSILDRHSDRNPKPWPHRVALLALTVRILYVCRTWTCYSASTFTNRRVPCNRCCS